MTDLTLEFFCLFEFGICCFQLLYYLLYVKHKRQLRQLEAKFTIGSGASVFEQNCAGYHLTQREVEIALLISQGTQYKYIANALFISLDTVKSHVKNIFKKVGVNDKTELVYKLLQEHSPGESHNHLNR